MNILKTNIDSNKRIRIYDDTGRGGTFEVTCVLYEDNDIIVAEASNEEMRKSWRSNWDKNPYKILINKSDDSVSHRNLMFYLAENY